MDKGKTIKAYCGLNPNMTYKGIQFRIGNEYEIKVDGQIGEEVLYAYKSPLELLRYCSIYGRDGDNRFFQVELSGTIDDYSHLTRIRSSKIKIVAELKLPNLINTCIEWLKGQVEQKFTRRLSDNGCDHAKLGSTDLPTQIGSSGDNVQIFSSASPSQMAAHGGQVRIASSGDLAQIASEEYCAEIGSSGYRAQIFSSGCQSRIASSGDHAFIASLGDYAQVSSNGPYAVINTIGNYTQITSSGHYAMINSIGDNNIICCTGMSSMARAKIGSWITLAEWVYSSGKGICVPQCVRTEYVDGERIKADTWYRLTNGEFKECKPD